MIGQLVARALQAPNAMMMEVNLQVKNTAINKFVFSGPRFFLHEFNSTPHLSGPHRKDLLTYS